MRTRLFLLGLLLAAVGGLAQAKRPATDYAAYAGEPVRGFTYHHLYNVHRNNSRQMVVWTRPSTAYLLTLRDECEPLPGRAIIKVGGVDAALGQLRVGSNDVLIGGLRCRIDVIQPLDVARMKAERA